MLGTPITEENLNDLLLKHGLTEDKFHSLIGEFEESLDDNHFIEYLDMTLEYYLNHEED